MSRSRRRRTALLRPLPLTVAAVTAAAAAAIAATAALGASGHGGAVTVHEAANASGSLRATYRAGESWGTGYTGEYTITNAGTAVTTGWSLAFTLPSGTTLTSLWDGSYTDRGGRVTVTNEAWDAKLNPGDTVTIGFETHAAGTAGAPAGCAIDGTACTGGGTGGVPTATPTKAAPTTAAPTTVPPTTVPATPTATPTPSRTQAPTPTPTPTATSTGSAGATGFAPYVDTSLYPPFNLVSTAKATGVKQFNLAFVVSGGAGGCTPEWGGVTAIGSDPVAAQLSALRAIGGDVRISFGGADGSELATTCTSESRLQAAYQQVVSTYNVNKLDFDIEGAAVANTAANALRDQALAALQKANPGLQISFTLPVLPSGLTSAGDAVVTGAVAAGINITAVNVMAMDYGDGAAPSPSGQMGTFAIDAVTATDAQVASALGISDTAAWSRVAVTPMIGVNDTSDEIFTLANAQQLEAFAASKHLAWLSIWSAGRDMGCPGGVLGYASPTCSSIASTADQFMQTLGAY
jgi:hypothetical protein